MNTDQIISGVIERLEQNQALYRLENFVERMEALDELEFHLLDEIEQVDNGTHTELPSFIQQGKLLKLKLDDTNEKLFAHLLGHIRAHEHDTLKQYLRQAEQQILKHDGNDTVGYDELDMLVNGLLDVDLIPEESLKRDADMMFYQPTPVRIVLKLIDLLGMNAHDVFYDLGSGLGHVPILITLLTGIQTKGVERDDSYIRYSNECLKKLELDHVEFIHGDVRDVDYADGTIFYLYTPFRGELLQQVLAMLEEQSKQRPIRVCSYGPCTLEVSKQNWLQPIYETGKHENHFAIFTHH
jgi:hypothetical protein